MRIASVEDSLLLCRRLKKRRLTQIFADFRRLFFHHKRHRRNNLFICVSLQKFAFQKIQHNTMKTRFIFTTLALATAASGFASEPIAPRDTVKVIDIEEVVIIATPKENTRLRQQALTSAFVQLVLASRDTERANRVGEIAFRAGAQSLYTRLWFETHHLGLRAGHRFAHQYACRRIVCR